MFDPPQNAAFWNSDGVHLAVRTPGDPDAEGLAEFAAARDDAS